MKKIKFVYKRSHNPNDNFEEIIEFSDDTTIDEIEESFNIWAWERVGNSLWWEEV